MGLGASVRSVLLAHLVIGPFLVTGSPGPHNKYVMLDPKDFFTMLVIRNTLECATILKTECCDRNAPYIMSSTAPALGRKSPIKAGKRDATNLNHDLEPPEQTYLLNPLN